MQLHNLKLNQRVLQCRVSVNGLYSVMERESRALKVSKTNLLPEGARWPVKPHARTHTQTRALTVSTYSRHE